MDYATVNEESIGVGTVLPEFVPVTFAGDHEHAERLRGVLEQQNIPALAESLTGEEDIATVLGRGTPVLVPEHMHDRASDVIAADERENAATVVGSDDDDEEEEEFFDDDEDDEDFDADFDDLDDLDDEYEEEEEEEDDWEKDLGDDEDDD